MRLTYIYDFEEAALGNFENLPMHWFRIGSRAESADPTFSRQPIHQQLTIASGYPSYTRVGFNQPQAEPGNHYLVLGLNGGNVGAFLQVGAAPVVPGSDYLITARVRTSALQQAGAFLTAYFINGKGHRIEASQAVAGPIRTGASWQDVVIKLRGDFPDAAWIGLQAELRQPTGDARNPLGEHVLLLTEVTGEAGFDDIAIWQLPSVTVTTQSPANIIRAPQRPEIVVNVRDLTGRPLLAQVTMYDSQWRQVAQSHRQVGAGAPSRWVWSPPLPGYGWYLADLTVHELSAPDQPAAAAASNAPVARNVTALVFLAPERLLPEAAAGVFSVQATDLQEPELQLVTQLVESAELPGVTLSAWRADTTGVTLESWLEKLDQVIAPLQGLRREVCLSFSPVPEELARLLDVHERSPLELFSRPRADWEQFVKPLLMRYGQRVHHWQLGAPTEADGFSHANPAGKLTSFHRELENMAPQPQLIVPWRLDQQRDRAVHGPWTYLLNVPSGIRPAELGDHLVEWNAAPATRYRLHLQIPPADRVDHLARITDLTLRMLHGWEAGAQGVSLSRPWTTFEQRELTLQPDPLLGALVGVGNRLALRRVLRRMTLGHGIESLILDGQDGGCLAFWSEDAAPEDCQLSLYLGEQPELLDVWGNRTTLAASEGRHPLTATALPQFVEGIDVPLALLRASFELDQPFVESLQQPHQRVLRLQNPWPRTISGYLTVVSPERWKVQPQRTFFSIAAGQRHEIPVEILFPVSELAEPKLLTAQLDFTADRAYSVRFSTPVQVGLRDVQFDANLSLERHAETGRIDAVVTQMVTNRGQQPLTLYAFANLTGYPRRERTISGLKPGQSIIRRFRFPDAAAVMRDHVIRVGLRETSGPAVLNRVLSLETVAPR